MSETFRAGNELLEEIFSRHNGFRELRRAMQGASAPSIPYYGFYLTDLTFVEDGNPTYLGTGHCINFNKYRLAAHVLRELEGHQRERYRFDPLPHVQRFLETAPKWDEDQCHGHSVRLEPRR